jgi:phytoene dehydrogenase-like protein
MSRVLVVGAGLGGLAVSCRLAALGHDVVLREASDTVGGKLGSYAWQTHRWDTGPSLLTLPDTLRDTFAAAGGWPPDLVLTAIRPVLRYRLRDGRWTDSDSLGPSWESLLVRGRAMWEVSRGPFLESAPTAVALARLALRDPRALVTIAPGRTLAGLGRSLPLPLQDVLWRYATYSGSDPRRAPAALASIPAIERDRLSRPSRPGPRSSASRFGSVRRYASCGSRAVASPAHRTSAPTWWSAASMPRTSTSTCCRAPRWCEAGAPTRRSR